MARGPRLIRLLLPLAAVLLAHLVALDWLARQHTFAAALRPLPPPMFTRLLQPEKPPPAPLLEEKRPVARVRRAPAAMNSIALPVPAPTATQVPAAPAEATVAEPTAQPEATATASPAPAMDSWPADTRVNYRLGGRFRSGELYGNARVQWQREGSRYQVRVEIDVTLLASLVLTSQGEVTPRGLEPSAYEELRRSGPRGAKLGPFEITLANGRTVPRPQGVQDTASQFVDLAHRFATGQEALEVGRTVSFWMARPGAVDLWTYDIVERELLATPQLGPVEAFRLKPRPIANPRGNITAEMWFAPSLQYLPVRIRVSMGDEAVVDLIVDTIEQK